ncbi:MAG TPA: (2Fe-2S)-binding protein [Planctomycetota bacterium]|nr:(2Fe-2S)-binding protein [Planctomycetota bacterium]
MGKTKYLCDCLKVTTRQVAAAVRCGKACSIADVTTCTGAGGGCTACHPAIRELLERERARRASVAANPALHAG